MTISMITDWSRRGNLIRYFVIWLSILYLLPLLHSETKQLLLEEVFYNQRLLLLSYDTVFIAKTKARVPL